MILPQFCWRQILVLSAHQIVIGKELEVCLGNLQACLLYVSAGEEIGVRQHVVVYQLAHNLVREWATVAADDVRSCQPLHAQRCSKDSQAKQCSGRNRN